MERTIELVQSIAKEKAAAQKVEMDWRDSLMLYFEEYMAGGFDEKWVRPEFKELFSDVEGYLMEDEEIPEELVERWMVVCPMGIYL